MLLPSVLPPMLVCRHRERKRCEALPAKWDVYCLFLPYIQENLESLYACVNKANSQLTECILGNEFYVLSKNKEMIQKPFAISSNCKVLLPMECWKNTKRANGSTHRCYVEGSDAINPLAQNKSHNSYFYFRFFFSGPSIML